MTITMVRSTQSSAACKPLGPHAAVWTFIVIAWLAAAAGAIVAGGAAGHSQLTLANASVEVLAGPQDICTGSTANEAPIHSC